MSPKESHQKSHIRSLRRKTRPLSLGPGEWLRFAVCTRRSRQLSPQEYFGLGDLFTLKPLPLLICWCLLIYSV